jgi:hypothetical protein
MKSRAPSRQLLDVGAADEGAPAGPGHDREAQQRVGGGLGGAREDVAEQRSPEAVEPGGIVDRQMQDVAAFGPLLPPDENRHCPSARLPRRY